MKKIKCEKYKYNIGSAFFAFLGMSNIFGFQQWSKYDGWHEPNKIYGVVLLVIALLVYIYIKKVCDNIKVVKCKNCGEVFSEVKLNNNKCSECGGDCIDIHEYHKTSNKN
jgi:hypothetical protein